MTATAPAVRDEAAGSAWLAAYALGLAYSQRPQTELVADLRDALAGGGGPLESARTRLAQAAVAEPSVRHEALELLELAAHDPPVAGESSRRQGRMTTTSRTGGLVLGQASPDSAWRQV